MAEKCGEAETIREMFRQLYAGDGGDLSVRQEKINAFLKSCDELLTKHYPTSHLYKNDQRSAMAYLWFYDPEHNFMCKATEAQYLANAAEFYDDWGTYASFRLDVYYRFCAALLNEIRSNTALMNIHQSRFEGHEAEMHPDINLPILPFLQSVASPAALRKYAYFLRTKIPLWPQGIAHAEIVCGRSIKNTWKTRTSIVRSLGYKEMC